MSKLFWSGVRYYAHNADLSGYANTVSVDHTYAMVETTNFNSGGAQEFIPGLESTSIEAGGQIDAGGAGLPDDAFWGLRRVVAARTIGPNNSGAVASVAYFTKASITDVKRFGAIGEILPWNESSQGSWPLVRGAFLSAAATAVTADGNGTAVQLTGTSATQRLYAAIHVLAYSGFTSVAAKIQSDDSGGFSSGTDRLTFTTITGVGSEVIRESSVGANADDQYRVVWDVTGSGSISAVVVVGVAG
jgi:hypothetical protein